MDRSTSLFVFLATGLFLLLNIAFPPAGHALLSGLADGAWGGTASGWNSEIWVLVAELLLLVPLALCLAWCFARLAEMTSSAAICRAVLGTGALITAGHLLIVLWGGFHTGSQSMLLQRIVLSAWVVTVCGAVVNAILRFGPEPESRFDTAGYRA